MHRSHPHVSTLSCLLFAPAIDAIILCRSMCEVERALIKMPHKPLKTSDRNYQIVLRQFEAFRKKYPGKPVTFYSNRNVWL